jgi:hypothetical protein
MASAREKAKAKAPARFKDLKATKNPKGGDGSKLVRITSGPKFLNPQPLPP